jgi:hypothetical protein
MHDDDDTYDGDPPSGQVYHSGIRRESDVEPADYALPPEAAALEGGYPEREAPEVSRRRALGLLAMGAATVSATFWFGRASVGDGLEPVHRDPSKRLKQADLDRIEAARVWAYASIEKLIAARPAFLWNFLIVEPDAAHVHGLERLCEYAILHGGQSGFDTAVEILATFERVPAPMEFERHRDKLQKVILQWQTRTRSNRRDN